MNGEWVWKRQAQRGGRESLSFVVKDNQKIKIARSSNTNLFFVIRTMEEITKRSGKNIEMDCFPRVIGRVGGASPLPYNARTCKTT